MLGDLWHRCKASNILFYSFVSPKISVFQFRSPVSQLILHYILGYWGSIHEVIVAHPLVCVLFGFNIWMCVFFGSIRLEHLQRLNQGKSILSRHSVVPERIWCVLLIIVSRGEPLLTMFWSSLIFSFCSRIYELECLMSLNPAAQYWSINRHPEWLKK